MTFGTTYERAHLGYLREGGQFGTTFDRAHRGYLVDVLVRIMKIVFEFRNRKTGFEL